MTNLTIPLLSIITGSALVDSINPSAIGVLILIIAVLLGRKNSMGRVLLLCGLYISSLLLTYFLAGLGIMYYLAKIPHFIAEYLSIFIGIIIVLAGIFEIKDFFWYKKGYSLQIPILFAKKIHDFTKNISIPGVVLLGSFIAAIELPYTGAPYLAVLTILSLHFDFNTFFLLFLYNLIFSAPLIIILILIASGTKITAVKNWKQQNKGYMKFLGGFLLILLGWLLILFSSGILNFR